MSTETHACPLSTLVTDLPVLTPDSNTYLLGENINEQGESLIGRISVSQAILNSGLPLLRNSVDTWVNTNSANVKAATSWFLTNNVKITRANTWVQQNSGNTTISTQWVEDNKQDIDNAISWLSEHSALLVPYESVLEANVVTWVTQNSSTFNSIEINEQVTTWVESNSSVLSNVIRSVESITSKFPATLEATAWVNSISAEIAWANGNIDDGNHPSHTWTSTNSASIQEAIAWIQILSAITHDHEELENSVFSWVTSNSSSLNDLVQAVSDVTEVADQLTSSLVGIDQITTWVQENSGINTTCHVTVVEITDVKSIPIQHNLMTEDVIVQVFDAETKDKVECVVHIDNLNTIHIEVGDQVEGVYKVVIFGNTNVVAQNTFENSILSWVQQNSTNIEETITWVNLLSGGNSEATQKQAAVMSWVQQNSGLLGITLNQSTYTFNWVSNNGTNIVNTVSWAQSQSSNLTNAIATSYIAHSWIDSHADSIDEVVSFTQASSSTTASTALWLANNVQGLYQTRAWVQENSAFSVWFHVLTSTYLEHEDLEEEVFAWVASNSGIRISSDIVDWYNQKSEVIDTLISQYTPISSTLLDSVNWYDQNNANINESTTWVEENSTTVQTIAFTVQVLYDDLNTTTSWANSASAKYDSASSWVRSNSAAVTQNSGANTQVRNWVNSNSASLEYVEQFINDNDADLSNIVTWFRLISSLQTTFAIHTWVENNSSVQYVNQWVRDVSSDIIDTRTWVVQNSDASVWVEANSAETSSAVEWTQINRDLVDAATQWVLANQQAAEDVSNTFPGVSANYEDAALWVYNNGIYAYQASLWYLSNSEAIDQATTWFIANSGSLKYQQSWLTQTSAAITDTINWVTNNKDEIIQDINTLNLQVTGFSNAALWVQKYETPVQDILTLIQEASSALTITQQNSASWINAVTSSAVWELDLPIDTPVGNIIIGDNLVGDTAIQILEKMLVGNSTVVIVIQPTSRTVNPNATAVFSVSALGNDLTYQWYKNTTLINSATASILTLFNVSYSDSATYFVKVSNPRNSTNSNPVTLTVRTSAGFTTHPTSPVNLIEPATLSLYVDVSGTPPISYQWYKNNIPVINAEYASFTITSTTSADSGVYTVVASNLVNSVTSTDSTVHIYKPVSITQHPQSVSINPGASTVLTVGVLGSEPLTYQWMFNGSDISGATLSSYTATQAGSYTVTVTNPANSVTSNAAVVAVRTPVGITVQPAATIVRSEPESFTLSVTVTGTTPVSYAWIHNGNTINGATNDSLTISPTTTADTGMYSVCASNLVNSVTSIQSDVNVYKPVSIITQPVGSTINPGESTVLTVSAFGSGPIRYQWRLNNIDINGATLPSYTATQAGSYTVAVTGPVNTVVSNAAVVAVRTPVGFVTQPNALTELKVPDSLTLQATLSGTDPISYAWLYNDSVITGATSNTYTISQVATSNSGVYKLSASNLVNSVVSIDAVVNVYQGVSIVIQPQSFYSLSPGQSAVISVSAIGSEPISYQWYKFSTPIDNATTRTYTATEEGDYSVLVTGPIDHATSTTATVQFNGGGPVDTAVGFVSPPEPLVNLVTPYDTTLTLQATVTGSAPISYAWLYNDAFISGANSRTYTLTPIATANTGVYTLSAFNAVNSVSASSVVNIYEGASFVIQPQDQTINPGDTAVFTASAVGSTPITYAWYYKQYNGSTSLQQQGASNIFSTNNVSNGDIVFVRATGPGTNNTVESRSASIAVREPVVFITPPTASLDLVTPDTTTLTLQASVAGTAPISYAWLYNDAFIAGANSRTYTLTPIATANTGVYTLSAHNLVNSISASSVVNIYEHVSFVIEPQDQTINPGDTVVLTASAVGSTPITYAWYYKPHNGSTSLLQQGASNTYTVVNAHNNDQYTVVVTGPGPNNNVTSNPVTFTVRTPVGITVQPVATIVRSEPVSFTLSVTVTGTTPVSYAWIHNGNTINGATNDSLTISPTTTADTGMYSVCASNLVNSVTSIQSDVNVYKPVSIITQPVGSTINPGESTVLTVSAFGSGPIRYQWRLNNIDINGATLPSYTATQDGSYTAAVTGPVNTAISNAAVVAVRTPVGITVQPAATIVKSESESFTLSVTVTGTTPISYAWIRNNAVINGATNDSLTISPTTTADTGMYSVCASNLVNSVTSIQSNVSIYKPVSIITQPVGNTINPSESIVLTVSAFGSSIISYQWRLNNVDINGATLPSYTATQAGSYTVTVTNPANSVTSNAAVVAVRTPVGITVQPAATIVRSEPESFTLSVTVTGTTPVSYAWIHNGNTINGATNDSLTISPTTTADTGMYSVCASNLVNSVTSIQSDVNVYKPVSIITQPVGSTINPGESTVLTVSAFGSGPIRYQWRLNNIDINGATLPSYTATQDGSYTAAVTGPVNTAISNAAVVAVRTPVGITVQPAATIVKSESESFTLSVTVTGTTPISYAWIRNNAVINGATNDSLTISPTTTADTGMYSVCASNLVNSVTSIQSNVSIYKPVSIITQPVGNTINPSESIVLTVSAFGSSIISYQWRLNNVDINGATLPSYTATQAGSYTVAVTGPVNTVVSNAAVVAVRTPVGFVTQPNALTELKVPDSLTLQATLSGTDPISYAWLYNDSVITGATSNTYTISQVATSNSGVYKLSASNLVNSVVSIDAVVNVYQGVSIVIQPQSFYSLSPGQSAVISVSAIGSEPISYQWYKFSTPIDNATTRTYTATAAGDYSVLVTGPIDHASSTTATVQVITNNPVGFVTLPPPSRTAQAGNNLTLTSTVSGTEPINYAWLYNNNVITGATSNTYSLTPTTTSDTGMYTLCASNMVNSVSAESSVIIYTPVTILTHPQSTTVLATSTVTLSVVAETVPANALVYQWYSGVDPTNLTLIPNVLTSTYTFVATTTMYFKVYVYQLYNSILFAASDTALITVVTPIGFTAQPNNQTTITEPNSIVLNATLSGTQPYAYQWLRNNTPIANATSVPYTITPTTTANTGSYSLCASNLVNSVTSTGQTITVYKPVTILTHPANVSIDSGSSTVLTVSAFGSSPLSYLWNKDNVDIGSATLRSLTATQAGNYKVTVTNPAGSVTSNIATVTVNTAPPPTTSYLTYWGLFPAANRTDTTTVTSTNTLNSGYVYHAMNTWWSHSPALGAFAKQGTRHLQWPGPRFGLYTGGVVGTEVPNGIPALSTVNFNSTFTLMFSTTNTYSRLITDYTADQTFDFAGTTSLSSALNAASATPIYNAWAASNGTISSIGVGGNAANKLASTVFAPGGYDTTTNNNRMWIFAPAALGGTPWDDVVETQTGDTTEYPNSLLTTRISLLISGTPVPYNVFLIKSAHPNDYVPRTLTMKHL